MHPKLCVPLVLLLVLLATIPSPGLATEEEGDPLANLT